MTRWEELQADIAQEHALAQVEGDRWARRRMEQRIRAEKQWFQVTSTRWREREDLDDDG